MSSTHSWTHDGRKLFHATREAVFPRCASGRRTTLGRRTAPEPQGSSTDRRSRRCVRNPQSATPAQENDGRPEVTRSVRHSYTPKTIPPKVPISRRIKENKIHACLVPNKPTPDPDSSLQAFCHPLKRFHHIVCTAASDRDCAGGVRSQSIRSRRTLWQHVGIRITRCTPPL